MTHKTKRKIMRKTKRNLKKIGGDNTLHLINAMKHYDIKDDKELNSLTIDNIYRKRIHLIIEITNEFNIGHDLTRNHYDEIVKGYYKLLREIFTNYEILKTYKENSLLGAKNGFNLKVNPVDP